MLSINHQVQLKKRQPMTKEAAAEEKIKADNQNKPIDANVKIFGKFEFMAKEKKTKRRAIKKVKVQDENDLLLAAVDMTNVNVSNVRFLYQDASTNWDRTALRATFLRSTTGD
jgi:actin-related protein